MVEYLGCSSREEFIKYTGNSFKGIVHPEDYEKTVTEISRQIERDNLDHVISRTLRKDCSVRWLDDYDKYISSEDMGNVFFVFAVSRRRNNRNDAGRPPIYHKPIKKYGN